MRSLSVTGADNIYDAIEDMIGYRPGPWMKWSWIVITPVLCVVSTDPRSSKASTWQL